MNIKLKLFLFSILISFSSLSFADDDGTWSYETYETYSLGTSLRLTGCLSSCPGDLVIPSMIGSLSVTAIGESAFGNEQLTSLVFPASIVSIGDNAFEKNELTLVQFKGSRPQLSRSTSFSGNPNLTTINICGKNSGWPGEPISNGSTTINIQNSAALCPLNPDVNLDVNCTNDYDALNDGLLILRGLWGLEGGTLIKNVGFGLCNRSDNFLYVNNMFYDLDVDQSGDTNPVMTLSRTQWKSLHP